MYTFLEYNKMILWGGSAERDVMARVWPSRQVAHICDSFIRVTHPYVWLIWYVWFTDRGRLRRLWTCQKRHTYIKRDLCIFGKRPVCMSYTCMYVLYMKRDIRIHGQKLVIAHAKRDLYVCLYVCCNTYLWKETCMYVWLINLKIPTNRWTETSVLCTRNEVYMCVVTLICMW